MALLLFIILGLLIRLAESQDLKFPDDFKFGVATSSYQIEGAWNEDGKTPNIWDTATQNHSYLIKDASTGNIACDSYKKWEEDISMIKNLGVNHYRFSISWTRLFPEGYITRLNPEGLGYYNRLIDKLIENGIEPMVTIYHWDLPKIFAPLGGWTNSALINIYVQYAREVFKLFGDRVKIWNTINEPRLICGVWKGLVGDVNPNFPFGVAEYLCYHNLLKAHAEVYHIYDKEFRPTQKGRISIALDMTWWEPENPNNPEDVRLAEQNRQFDIGISANPILNFDYPQVVIDRVAERSKIEGFPESRLPKFTYQEKVKIRGTYDFLSINFYFVQKVAAQEEPPAAKRSYETDAGGHRYIDETMPKTGCIWFKVAPWAFRNVLKWVKNTYDNPEVFITESGYADDSDIIEDYERINYLKSYLNEILGAIHEDGVNIKGYTVWSLMDNFEWSNGYTLKFGLYHVNFTDPNRTRTPKKSVEFFKNVIKTRKIN